MRNGYIFLMSVLFVSAIAISVLGVYLLLSIASLQNGELFADATQALQNTEHCAEYALQELLTNSAYTGNEVIDLPNGDECYILAVGGFGNENRTLCIEGVSSSSTRRVEIVIEYLLPSISIYAWNEVATITACSY